MKLFGKNRQNGETPKKEKNKKDKSKKKVDAPAKKKLKFSMPSDVKISYVMPFLFAVGAIGIVGSEGAIIHNNSVYKAKVLASSMEKGAQLPSWGRTVDAKLTLGNTILSPDGKDMAVQVMYDTSAHNTLTSFGDQYRLRVITPQDNPMKGVKLSYGMFGTDGDGVLTIHSDKGFSDKAFVVMIIDGSQLVTSNDLQSGSNGVTTDQTLDDSITAQLSGSDSASSGDSSSFNKKQLSMPPIYYVRLNAKNVSKVKHDWTNDRQLVKELFVNDKINSLKKSLAQTKSKMNATQKSLDEMNKRLSDNPNDKIAQTNQQSLQGTLATIQESYSSAQANLKKLEDSTLKKNILAPKQDKHELLIRDISGLNN